MSALTREIAAQGARRLVADLEAHGIQAPADVHDALAHLDTVEALRPPFVDLAELTDAYLSADPEAVATATRAHVDYNAAHTAWKEATIKAGQRVQAAVTANGDDLTRALAKVAAPLIRQLEKAAQIDTHDTTALIRAGRSKDAELAARVELIGSDLAALYALRARITKGAGYGRGGIDCGMWQDPRKAREAGNLTADRTAAQAYLRGIRNGAGLWFPTPGEAESKAAAIVAAERSARAEQEAEDWRRATGAKLRTA